MDPLQRDPAVPVLGGSAEGLREAAGCLHRRREAEGAGGGSRGGAGHQGGRLQPPRPERQRPRPGRGSRAGEESSHSGLRFTSCFCCQKILCLLKKPHNAKA